MDYDEMKSYWEGLGFEVADIDNQTVLFLDLEEAPEWGYYALITDMDGRMPDSLTTPVIWSVYDENDAFQWSVTIENATYLHRLFEETISLEDVLQSLQNLREDNILEADASYGEDAFAPESL